MEEILPKDLIDAMKRDLTMNGKMPITLRSQSYMTFNDYRISMSDEGSLKFDEIVYRHDNGNVVIRSDDESDGTKKLFCILSNLLMDESDLTFIMDELDSKLHPNLTYRLIKLFLGCESMSEKQLIFTTHESSLMDFKLLRRDEIWFTDKDEVGASHIYSMEEYNERSDRRIEKAYREGRYKGVPVFSTIYPYE